MRPENLAREPLRITYRLYCGDGESPADKAADIAHEQTVELPPGCAPDAVERMAVGRPGKPEMLAEGEWRVGIDYERWTGGDEVPQLFNLLFGNISLKRGIVVEDVDWPPGLLELLPGPRYGLAGVRERLDVPSPRALLCSALKPMGLSAAELADLCAAFSAGGVDIVKDDHGLADQATAPFEERVRACCDALARSNARHGSRTAYFPNVTGRVDSLERRLNLARELGCRGILVSPLVTGLDTLRWIRETYDFVVLCHPALAGAFLQPGHGLAPELLLAELFRLAGGDGVIFPNAAGRFPFDEDLCSRLRDRLRKPLGPVQGAFPVPAGGIAVGRIEHWLGVYGPDTIFLIGGSLYARPDLVVACRELMERLTGGTYPRPEGLA